MNGTKVRKLKKIGNRYLYRGRLWKINNPVKSTAKGKKMMVLASKIVEGERRVQLIHFGAVGYGHNYSKKAKQSYLKRSGGIRNKAGKLTKNDHWSANYWGRKILWPSHKKSLCEFFNALRKDYLRLGRKMAPIPMMMRIIPPILSQ